MAARPRSLVPSRALRSVRGQGGGGGGASRPGTRERILDAAERRFADHGYSGTAMRDVAAAVELNPASLYNYFSGKKGLYEAVLERGLRPVRELLDTLAASDWSPENLDRETDEFMRRMAERPHLPRLLYQESLAGGEQLRRLTHRWLGPLFARALDTVQRNVGLRRWREDELPLLLMAFHHLILGHFATTSLMREVSSEDPLSPAALERSRRFMRRVVRLLIFDEQAVGSSLHAEGAAFGGNDDVEEEEEEDGEEDGAASMRDLYGQAR